MLSRSMCDRKLTPYENCTLLVILSHYPAVHGSTCYIKLQTCNFILQFFLIQQSMKIFEIKTVDSNDYTRALQKVSALF